MLTLMSGSEMPGPLRHAWDFMSMVLISGMVISAGDEVTAYPNISRVFGTEDDH